MPKRDGKRPLFRKGQRSQKTEQGLEIPLPKRKDVFGLLDKAAKKREPDESSERGKGKRRTSRDQ
jgi:hypothetical protein